MLRLQNAHHNAPSRRAFALASGLLLAAISAPVAMAVDAGRPPSRIVPSRGLYLYVEYDGLDAHADAWKATAAFDMLGQTGAGAMISDVLRQVLDRMSTIVPKTKVNGSDLVALQEHIGSFRHGDANDVFAPLIPALKPEYRGIFEAAKRAVGEAVNQQLRDELFRHLGPTWCIRAASGGKPDATGPAVPMFLIEIDNAETFDKFVVPLVYQINIYLRDQRAGLSDRRKDVDHRPVMAFERLPAPERGYRLISPAGVVPWLGADLQPTVLLGKSFLAAGATPALARAAIAAESRSAGRWAPDGELRKSFECLPERLSLLSVGDTCASAWPEAIASFPDTVGPFLYKFIGLPLPDANQEASPDLLALLGVPKRGQSGVRVDMAKLPTADELRSHLFPSVVAATVDVRSFRFLSVEAFPLACVGLEAKYGEGRSRSELTIGVKFGPGN